MLDSCLKPYSRLLPAIAAAIVFLLLMKTLDQAPAFGPHVHSWEHSSRTDQAPITYDPRPWISSAGTAAKAPHSPVIAKVSMMYGDNKYYIRAIETHLKHAKRHGYPIYVLRKELLDGMWNKLLYLLYVMVEEQQKGDQGAEWIFWFDADSAIVNPAIPLSTFLPPPQRDPNCTLHVLASKDQSGFNAGMFFIRNNAWSLRLLVNALTYTHHQPSVHLDFWEQSSLYLEFNHTENRQHVLYMPRTWFNTYEFHHAYEGQRGDFVVHFPGLKEDRWAHMGKWLDILEQPRSARGWEVDVARTRFPGEVAEFWDTVGKGRRQLDVARERSKGQEPTVQRMKGAMERLEEALWSETDQLQTVKRVTEELMKEMGKAGLIGAVSVEG